MTLCEETTPNNWISRGTKIEQFKIILGLSLDIDHKTSHLALKEDISLLVANSYLQILFNKEFMDFYIISNFCAIFDYGKLSKVKIVTIIGIWRNYKRDSYIELEEFWSSTCPRCNKRSCWKTKLYWKNKFSSQDHLLNNYLLLH